MSHFPVGPEHCGSTKREISGLTIIISLVLSLVLSLVPSPVMVRVPELPDLEPENRSGTPEGRFPVPSTRSLGAFPGSSWYQFTPSIPMLFVLPEREMVILWPTDPDTEGG